MTPSVPPFIQVTSGVLEAAGCYSGIFHHNGPIAQGDAHTRWWPSTSGQPQIIFLFIPGNPGLIDFYTSFLSALHESHRDGLAILAHAHLGHTPHLKVNKSTVGLLHQVEAVLEVFDSIRAHWLNVKVVLAGHSLGSWVATQVLKARPNDTAAVFFLFPTISLMSQTPNGKRLSWVFRAPMPSVVAALSVLVRPISYFFFPCWPRNQRTAIISLLGSPSAIFTCLTMAHEEMATITTLETSILNEHASKIWACYAEKDDWVGEEREKVVQALGSDGAIQRIVHCKHGVKHAFCIYHSNIIAEYCAAWLKDVKLLAID